MWIQIWCLRCMQFSDLCHHREEFHFYLFSCLGPLVSIDVNFLSSRSWFEFDLYFFSCLGSNEVQGQR
ncbi:hypothetical protein LXL04_034171 [Taraxacum kok-saghyz]